jgi:transmembrane sensor
MSQPLRSLGELVATTQDAELERGRVVERARARFHEVERSRGLLRRGRIAASMALAAALAAFVAWMFLLRPGPVVECWNDAGVRVHEREEVRSDTRELGLRFSDGSTVLFEPRARGHVGSLTRDGGAVILEDGKASVSVPPKRGRRWVVGAGPYEVLVTGTRFDVAWRAQSRRFELVMFDGSVEVRGPGVGGRTVVAGQRVELEDARAAPPSVSSSAATTPAPAPASAEATATASPAAKVPAPGVSSASDRSWQSLARQGRFDDATALAEAAGFEGICASAGAADLLSLGDAARFAKKPGRARSAYDAARARFPGSPEASRAAFTLGVMAFPSPSALPWFERYLTESPGGRLASEAQGRILEIHHRSGNVAAARAAAERYLRSYPNGAHAKLARSLLPP